MKRQPATLAAAPCALITPTRHARDQASPLDSFIRSPFLLLLCLILVVGLPARSDDATVDRWRSADSRTVAAMLSLARHAFDAYARRREEIDPPRDLPPILKQRATIFVSAMRHGAPRCCMGTLYPNEPNAALEIVSCAIAAAGRDRRFPPIKPSELRGLTLIVSVVGAPRLIGRDEVATLDSTRDGLAVKAGSRIGVVLSGETSSADRMERWARIRAGASESETVQYLRLAVVRFVEPNPGGGRQGARQ